MFSTPYNIQPTTPITTFAKGKANERKRFKDRSMLEY
jgi:hypothetical protein